MDLTVALILLLAGVLVLGAFVWHQRKPRTISSQQAASAIANALDLDGSGNHDEFDLFVGRPVADPHIERLRKEILAISVEEGQPVPGRDFGPKAEAWLRKTLEQLTRGGSTHGI